MKKNLNTTNFLKILVWSSFQLLSKFSYSQDIHFTQIQNTQLLVNPALTGNNSSMIRTSLNSRRQWGNISEAFKTSLFSIDAGFKKKQNSTGFLGVGLVLLNDQSGFTQLNTNQVFFSVAYHSKISYHSKVSAGINGGIIQRNINSQKFQWNSQYDGSEYNPNSPSYSNEINQKILFSDFSVGLNWEYKRNEKNISSNNQFNFNSGIAIHHVSKPSYSFNKKSNESLPIKFVLNVQAEIGIKNSKYAIEPIIQYVNQNRLSEIILGSEIKYQIKEESVHTNYVNETAVYCGILYRVRDAIAPMVKVKKGDFLLTFSYDINTSSLIRATRGNGGPELCLMWRKTFKN